MEDVITESFNIGDTMQMIAVGETEGVFHISENNWFSDDPIVSIQGEPVDGNLYGRWTITREDYYKPDDHEQFFFELDDVPGKSEYISLNDTYDDSPMNITLVSPECGDSFNESENVTIEIVADDLDDFIDGNVSVDGVNIKNFTNGVESFNHSFDSPGTSQVVIKAVNSRGKEVEYNRNIIILEKDGTGYVNRKYVAACIFEPKDFTDTEGSNIHFNASATRGVEINNSVTVHVITPEKYPDRFKWFWWFMPDNISGPNDFDFYSDFPTGDNSVSLRVAFD